jgi:DNA-directed RNA polymerase specialized sigma24 family protein
MEGFESVYRQHFAAVLRLAVSIVGRRDIAEDLVADAFLELHRRFAQIHVDELPAWLFVVVRNKARDHWRREKVRERHARWLASHPPAVARPTAGASWLGSDRLAPVQRVCLELHYSWGYTVDEIAGRLGLTAGQVKGQLQRARQQLREIDKEMAG